MVAADAESLGVPHLLGLANHATKMDHCQKVTTTEVEYGVSAYSSRIHVLVWDSRVGLLVVGRRGPVRGLQAPG